MIEEAGDHDRTGLVACKCTVCAGKHWLVHKLVGNACVGSLMVWGGRCFIRGQRHLEVGVVVVGRRGNRANGVRGRGLPCCEQRLVLQR